MKHGARNFRSKPVGWQHDTYRHYLAAKYGSAGGLAARNGSVGKYKYDSEKVDKYVYDELKSNGDKEFIGPVKEQFAHPVYHVDRTWMSMERAAGQDGKMATDPAERNIERGAAIFGQIITQGSAVPLINPKKEVSSNNTRKQMLDIVFGDDECGE